MSRPKVAACKIAAAVLLQGHAEVPRPKHAKALASDACIVTRRCQNWRGGWPSRAVRKILVWDGAAAFVTGSRRRPCGIPPKSALIPGSQNRLQSELRSRVCNPQPRARVSPRTTVTFEDAGTAEGHESRGMPCGAFARLPRGRDTELECGVAHPDPRAPAFPLVRRDRSA